MAPLQFGRVENPEELDLEPIEIEITGYTLDREPVSQIVRFRPAMPVGSTIDIIRYTDAKGNVPQAKVIDFLDACPIDEDKELWKDFLDRTDVMIEFQTLLDVYMAVVEVYSARPFTLRSGSSGGTSSTKPTSKAAADYRASRSKKRN